MGSNGITTLEGQTAEQVKQEAITDFQSFIVAYSVSELAPAAQNYIGQCYFELNGGVNAEAAFGKDLSP